jgi:Fe-S-cluster containining protein
LSEAHLISDKLGLSWVSFSSDYIDPRWPGTRNLLIRHVNEACAFLKPSTNKKQFLCSIHDFKPSCCRNWKQGLDRQECQNGLLKRWGLKINQSGKIQGAPEKLELFKNYLQILQ